MKPSNVGYCQPYFRSFTTLLLFSPDREKVNVAIAETPEKPKEIFHPIAFPNVEEIKKYLITIGLGCLYHLRILSQNISLDEGHSLPSSPARRSGKATERRVTTNTAGCLTQDLPSPPSSLAHTTKRLSPITHSALQNLSPARSCAAAGAAPSSKCSK